MKMVDEQIYLEVTEITEIGEGMRVCIDFVDVLSESDGLFVGNTGEGYIKVLSENRHSEGYPPRPFRINCGSFHQYIYQEDKSNYLHEIEPGVGLIIAGEDEKKSVPVGRVKMEKRPLIRVVCSDGNKTISATLQKSTSVFVTTEAHPAVNILDLKTGDRILCQTDKPGRHLGKQIDEIIVEK